MDSFVSAEKKSLASAIVGGVNILAGIISTLQNFLKVAELMEGHRIAGVSWGKICRNISIELALDPSRRTIQSDFLKLSRSEYDRLIEAGPTIDDNIIKSFNKKFKGYKVSVPAICNGLDKCTIYKVKNNNSNNNSNEIQEMNNDNTIIEDIKEIALNNKLNKSNSKSVEKSNLVEQSNNTEDNIQVVVDDIIYNVNEDHKHSIEKIIEDAEDAEDADDEEEEDDDEEDDTEIKNN